MLTFTRDDNNTYIVTANEKFIGRLYKDKDNGMWYLEYNGVPWGHVHVPYETSLELTLSDLEDEFNIWLIHKDVEYFGELSHIKYKE